MYWRLWLLCSSYFFTRPRVALSMVPISMHESRHATRGLSLIATRRNLFVSGRSLQPATKDTKATPNDITGRGKLAPMMPWQQLQQYPSILCAVSLVIAAALLFYHCYGTLVRCWISIKNSLRQPGQLRIKQTNCMDQDLYVEDGRSFCNLDEWYDSNTGTEGTLGAEATPQLSRSGRRGAVCHTLDPELNDVDAQAVSLAAKPADESGARMSVPLLETQAPPELPNKMQANSGVRSPSDHAVAQKQPDGQSSGSAVTFALSLNTHHEVTPYAEVYGAHPNDFNFDKRVEPPSWCFVGDAHSDSDADDHEELDTKEAYYNTSCRQMTITSSGELAPACPWKLPKGDLGRNHDAEQDVLDDEQDTQSPDSSEVHSDGSADSNMGDEDECGGALRAWQARRFPHCEKHVRFGEHGRHEQLDPPDVKQLPFRFTLTQPNGEVSTIASS